MAQDYDKIVKENLSPNILALLELFFGIKDIKTEPLDIKLQHTVEQEPDYQLRVLSKLRKFEKETFKILKNMPLLFDVPNDHLFIRGKKEGEEIGKEIGKEQKSIITIVSMLLKSDLEVPTIADLAALDIVLVKKIKKEFDKTTAKKIILTYQKKEGLTKKEKEEKAIALTKELLKMLSLSDDMIEELVKLKKEKIEQLRKEHKTQKNKTL